MRRITLFLIVTVVSLAALVAVVVAGYYVITAQSATNGYTNYNWMGQMMGGYGMGGYNAQVTTRSSAAPWFGVAFVALIAVAVVGIGGLVYFFAFPEIRNVSYAVPPATALSVQTDSARSAAAPAERKETVLPSPETPYASVAKTLTADERRVIDALKSHGGKYLQKYIRSETGLSRLQTHRIVARLAERGMVSLEKTGNTNAVALADWLK